MKKIQSLDKFETVNEKVKSPKVSGSFEISDNLKKVAKIQKTLIDLSQLLTEMSDEIVLLKTTYTNLDPESMNILTNMKYNIDNMVGALKRERKSGTNTGVIDNSKRLQRNLERLKKDFLERKSV
jgi:t-SNARE complex subunit (syntaxin)